MLCDHHHHQQGWQRVGFRLKYVERLTDMRFSSSHCPGAAEGNAGQATVTVTATATMVC